MGYKYLLAKSFNRQCEPLPHIKIASDIPEMKLGMLNSTCNVVSPQRIGVAQTHTITSWRFSNLLHGMHATLIICPETAFPAIIDKQKGCHWKIQGCKPYLSYKKSFWILLPNINLKSVYLLKFLKQICLIVAKWISTVIGWKMPSFFLQ